MKPKTAYHTLNRGSLSFFVDYRVLFHQVNTKSNNFMGDEVTSENLYFWCSRGEIKSKIDN